MKKNLSLILLLVIGSVVFGKGTFPNREQFQVRSEDGKVFILNTDISNVYEILGEPLEKKNLWAIYPNASCALYKIDYENISFLYYDIDNKIVRIVLYDDKYKIVDNDISIGSSYTDVVEAYGKPQKERFFFNKEKGKNEIQIQYSTMRTELSYVEQTVEYYYWIVFNFDENKQKCNLIMLNWNEDH